MKKTLLFCIVGLLFAVRTVHAGPGDLIVNGSHQVTQYGYTSYIGGNNVYWNGFKSGAPSGMWDFQ